uniref:preprotein translocase subunit SecY n=1 Tax=Alistipes shahii TaxID=328814 RepID=UPI003FEEDC19
IPVPYVDVGALSEYLNSMKTTVLGLYNVMSGGAFADATVFALSIQPYINASIIIQLLTVAIPALERMAREEGEEGRKKIASITRYTTVGIGLIQGFAYYMLMRNQYNILTNDSIAAAFVIIVTFVAGSAFIMWLGEKITDKGIGNGISLIIMIGIVARLPHALLAEVNARFQTASGSAIMLILELVLLFLVFMATIALVQAVRKVPVQYAKRIVGNKQYGGVRQYIPLKMNAANVMPIIFAQALMFIPALFSGTAFAAAFSSMTGFWYNFTLAVLVIAFTY